jgi:hypothetical protein
MSVVETLTTASNGLLMPSESEYPFEVICWENRATAELTTETLLELTQHPQGTPVEKVDLNYFFRNVAQEKEWHDDVQKANVAKFQTLINTLNQNLQDIAVYRIGSINLDVYIIGQANGNLIGLATRVVET